MKPVGEVYNGLKRVKVRIGSREFEIPLEEHLKIDIQNLNEELAEQPGRYAYWSSLAVAAEEEYERAKLYRDEVRARKYKEIKEKLEKQGKKVTENLINCEVTLDEEVKKAEEYVLERMQNRNILKAIREAFAQRKDSLISIASNLRVELDSELRFRRSNGEIMEK